MQSGEGTTNGQGRIPTLAGKLHGETIDEEDCPPLFSEARVSSRKSARITNEERVQSLPLLLSDFCNRTSCHGVPFFRGESFFGKYSWVVIFTLCSLFFSYQTYWTMSEYFEYRTIIEMQLKFEPAPFPAATVCNLNAFKYSELKEYQEIAEGFTMWERAMSGEAVETGGAVEGREGREGKGGRMKKINSREAADYALDVLMATANRENTHRRYRRQAVYHPIFVRCSCIGHSDQCVPNRNPLQQNASVCVCFEDATTGDIWPCYPSTVWSVKSCSQCSHSLTCIDPDHPNATVPVNPRKVECLCQTISHYCVVHPEGDIPWWNPENYTADPVTPATAINAEVVEAFGLEELRDKGAITTRTKENLIFLVAAMPREVRKQLSYTLDEFVLRCSFNSKDCDMDKDFKLHMDPEYGNCYTFNFNDSVTMKNSRAGPMYGLRLLLNVNQSDYMPTTEAAGVRIVVHEQDQEPFPDTFGYSAPTGFVSSFGLKTKVLHRLDEPWGKCSDIFRPPGYIYHEHYSPEGCYRNCFQHRVIRDCGCGDPRFPLPSEIEVKTCNARSNKDRSCLANITNAAGGFHHLQSNCTCVQPCTENVFETAYSASAWPAINFNIGMDCPGMVEIFNDSTACTEYYRVNTAYIEIYYEQLNFETLKETEGYTLVNLFSDFGGNIGLWIGFSVITMAELLELVFELFTFCFYHKPKQLRAKQRKRQEDERKRRGLPGLIHKHLIYNQPLSESFRKKHPSNFAYNEDVETRVD